MTVAIGKRQLTSLAESDDVNCGSAYLNEDMIVA